MGLVAAERNTMLDATDIDTVSLHTADPGTTGASEVSGGSPAYARKSLTWAAASGADKANSSSPTFDVPASTTVTHVGFWASSTFKGGGALTNAEVFSAQGQLTLTAAHLTLT